MTCFIKFEACAARDGETTIDDQILQSLDGLKSDEIFCDYIVDSNSSVLIGMGNNLRGGHLKLEYSHTKSKLFSVVEYSVSKKLNQDEEKELCEYTLGQLLDGIGDNLSQAYSRGNNIYISFADEPYNPLVEYRK